MVYYHIQRSNVKVKYLVLRMFYIPISLFNLSKSSSTFSSRSLFLSCVARSADDCVRRCGGTHGSYCRRIDSLLLPVLDLLASYPFPGCCCCWDCCCRWVIFGDGSLADSSFLRLLPPVLLRPYDPENPSSLQLFVVGDAGAATGATDLFA